MSAAFRCQLGEFDASTALEKLGSLIAAAAQTGFSTHHTKQTEAWQAELRFLRAFAFQLIQRLPRSCDWWLLFELKSRVAASGPTSFSLLTT